MATYKVRTLEATNKFPISYYKVFCAQGLAYHLSKDNWQFNA